LYQGYARGQEKKLGPERTLGYRDTRITKGKPRERTCEHVSEKEASRTDEGREEKIHREHSLSNDQRGRIQPLNCSWNREGDDVPESRTADQGLKVQRVKHKSLFRKIYRGYRQGTAPSTLDQLYQRELCQRALTKAYFRNS